MRRNMDMDDADLKIWNTRMDKMLEKIRAACTTDDELVADMERHLLPSVTVEQISGIFLGFINMVIMGAVSGSALAGVGQVSTINSAAMFFFSSFAVGGTVMVSQYMGAKNQTMAKSALVHSLGFGVCLSTLATVLMVVFRFQIVTFLFGAADPAVVESSLEYFLFSTLALPFWFIYFQACNIMRGSSETKMPMIISVLLNGLAVVLNVMFVLVFDMGAMGSGLATFLSVAISATFAFTCLFRDGYELNLRKLKGFRFSLTHIKDIVLIGLPASVENLMFNGGKVILSMFVAPMGTAMISGYQVGLSVLNIICIPQNTYSAVMVPIAGRLAGIRDRKRTIAGVRYINNKTIGVDTIAGIATLALAWPLCLLYTRDFETLLIGVAVCYMIALTLPYSPYCISLTNGFKAVKDANFSMMVAVVCMWIFRVGLGYFFGVVLGWKVYGIVLGMMTDTTVRCILSFYRFKGTKWLRHIEWNE